MSHRLDRGQGSVPIVSPGFLLSRGLFNWSNRDAEHRRAQKPATKKYSHIEPHQGSVHSSAVTGFYRVALHGSTQQDEMNCECSYDVY
mmetsp:Transcript_15986/g.19454  ORF Transcript_15986/g.19454 Transcript_15986/m.19454 type:complete len:88 (-) Transcript_15986:462-725(-)